MAYQAHSLNPLLGKKCDECRFCLYDNERHEYGCLIFNCIDYSMFVEFLGEYDEEKGEWE